MYKEFSGRIWESEAKYNEYKSNVRKYMSRSLAVEHYADCSGDDSVFKEPAFVKLKNYRAHILSINSAQALTDTNELIVLFDELIQKIGAEKFYKNEDGSVNFIWKLVNK